MNAANDTVTEDLKSLTSLYSFGSNPDDGKYPATSLVQGSDGNFYGTTSRGGSGHAGTIFAITPAGKLTTLHSFRVQDGEGSEPSSGLVEADDGNFYGTTEAGGAAGKGTVFVITPAGVLTTLHSFTGRGRQGAGPAGDLVQGRDGNFYGTTQDGGTSGLGTVFVMKPGGKVTTLHSFDNSDGAHPYSGLIQAEDGDFYGTCYGGGGGTFGYGTVFSINLAGKLRTVHNFSFVGDDGANPDTGLVQGRNHKLYGTTVRGGQFTVGTIFAFTSAATFKTIHVFSGGEDGSAPEASLAQGRGHAFYGITFTGGTANAGSVFSITPGGAVTVLYEFGGDAGSGGSVGGGVIQGKDGNLYGTTYYGGLHQAGTVYRLETAAH